MNLTEKQQKLLETIAGYKAEHGREPTQRELAPLMKMSQQSVHAMKKRIRKQQERAAA